MDRRRVIALTAVLVLIIGSAAAHAAPRWIAVGEGPEGAAPRVDVEVSAQGIVVDLTLAGLFVDEVELNGSVYTVLSVPECGLAGATGEPELPFRHVLVPIPNGPRLGAFAVTADTIPVLDQVTVIPAGAPEPDRGGDPAAPMASTTCTTGRDPVA